MASEFLKLREAAARLRVTPATARAWAQRDGVLRKPGLRVSLVPGEWVDSLLR